MTALAEWSTGTAEVIRIEGRFAYARCPHCDSVHAHDRKLLGSASLVAGCHAPPYRLREYSLPNQPKRNR